MTCTMSPEAIKNDESIGLPLIEVDKIFLDDEFNCRGAFSSMDCVELARDIAIHGLQQPVTVKPLNEALKADQLALNRGFTHKMIAGHRRLVSYRINKRDRIPCIVKPKDLSEFDAKDLNAIENLQRKELNLQQECNAIKHYWMLNWSREETAIRVGKSPGWVQIRYMLLNMPQEIQDAAGQGYIKTEDVKELNKYKNKTEQLKMAGIIRDKRKAGEKGVSEKIRKKDKPDTKKHRGRAQMFEMLHKMQDVFSKREARDVSTLDLVTPHGNTLATQTLAWCAGEITTLDFYMAMRRYCDLIGVPFEIPEMSSELDI